MENAEKLVEFCKENDRVCPKPNNWQKLWDMLPDKRRKGAGWEPPLPLILAAWWETNDMEKRKRLEKHIQWSEQNGAIEEISNYLQGLRETDWHHVGE